MRLKLHNVSVWWPCKRLARNWLSNWLSNRQFNRLQTTPQVSAAKWERVALRMLSGKPLAPPKDCMSISYDMWSSILQRLKRLQGENAHLRYQRDVLLGRRAQDQLDKEVNNG